MPPATPTGTVAAPPSADRPGGPGRRRWSWPLRRHRRPATSAGDDERGQTTTEYGLVILVAGGIALGVIAWAGSTGVFTDLFETVVDNLTANL